MYLFDRDCGLSSSIYVGRYSAVLSFAISNAMFCFRANSGERRVLTLGTRSSLLTLLMIKRKMEKKMWCKACVYLL